MKRYIIIIIFLICLFFNFYIGYNVSISSHQQNLIVDAVTNDDYDFFLKFNAYYDNTPEFENENILINKVYSSEFDEVGYNLIIRNIEESDLVLENETDEMKIVLSGNDGSYTFDYSADAYNLLNVINLQIEKNYIINECGTVLNKIEVYNPNNKIIVSSSLNINTDDLNKEELVKKSSGFSEAEILEMAKVSSFYDLAIQMIIYFAVVLVIIVVYCIILYINKLILNKKN